MNIDAIFQSGIREGLRQAWNDVNALGGRADPPADQFRRGYDEALDDALSALARLAKTTDAEPGTAVREIVRCLRDLIAAEGSQIAEDLARDMGRKALARIDR